MKLPDFDGTFDSLDETFKSQPEELVTNDKVLNLDTTDPYSYEASYYTLLTGVEITTYDIKLHKGRLPDEPPSDVHDNTHDLYFRLIKPISKQLLTRQADWNRLFKLNNRGYDSTLRNWRLQGRGGYPVI